MCSYVIIHGLEACCPLLSERAKAKVCCFGRHFEILRVSVAQLGFIKELNVINPLSLIIRHWVILKQFAQIVQELLCSLKVDSGLFAPHQLSAYKKNTKSQSND